MSACVHADSRIPNAVTVRIHTKANTDVIRFRFSVRLWKRNDVFRFEDVGFLQKGLKLRKEAIEAGTDQRLFVLGETD